jgi:hypothetical protein
MAHDQFDNVWDTVMSLLSDQLEAKSLSPVALNEKTNLLEPGFIDSQDLLDLVLDVETRCGCAFGPTDSISPMASHRAASEGPSCPILLSINSHGPTD